MSDIQIKRMTEQIDRLTKEIFNLKHALVIVTGARIMLRTKSADRISTMTMKLFIEAMNIKKEDVLEDKKAVFIKISEKKI